FCFWPPVLPGSKPACTHVKAAPTAAESGNRPCLIHLQRSHFETTCYPGLAAVYGRPAVLRGLWQCAGGSCRTVPNKTSGYHLPAQCRTLEPGTVRAPLCFPAGNFCRV